MSVSLNLCLIFFNDEEENDIIDYVEQENELTFKMIQLNQRYSKMQIFRLFNNTQQSNINSNFSLRIFPLLMNLIKLNFLETNSLSKKYTF
jgi:hypothetical protein